MYVDPAFLPREKKETIIFIFENSWTHRIIILILANFTTFFYIATQNTKDIFSTPSSDLIMRSSINIDKPLTNFRLLVTLP